MSKEKSTRRPFKVWDTTRTTRKALVVATLEELIVRGREKLGVGIHESIRAVLESDGTQVDDSEYFRSLPDNTVFLLLRTGERWSPHGVDIIKQALSSIPKIVCEAISSLDLCDEVPSWKIMENRGRITIVLTWDQRPGLLPPGASTSYDAYARRLSPNSISLSPSYSPRPLTPTLPSQKFHSSSGGKHISVVGGGSSMGIRTQISKDGKLETTINDFQPNKTPSITVISHEDPPYDTIPLRSNRSVPPLPHYHQVTTQAGHQVQPPYQYAGRGLPRQGSSSLESTAAPISVNLPHVHTMECSQRGHFPQQHPPLASSGRGSPPEPSYCDFHCCALHEEGRKIQVHKAVATSPIQDPGFHQDPRIHSGAKLHVRFQGVGEDKNGVRYSMHHGGISSTPFIPTRKPSSGSFVAVNDTATESSESETENNNSSVMEEESTSKKFLLLIDQLSLDQKRHLSIKDIGVILDRLSSKIIDVERLDRESEADDCYLWTIKATIRGDILQELGIIYNGNFYSVSEHPSYNNSHKQQGQNGQPKTSSSTSANNNNNSNNKSLGRQTDIDDEEDLRL